MTDNLRVICSEEGLQEHWLDLFDLLRVGDLHPDQLSLGMQCRISIIRGILAKPGLLLCDEPLASLDPENIERLITNIQVASRESSIPLLVMTHTLVDFSGLESSYYQPADRPAEILRPTSPNRLGTH